MAVDLHRGAAGTAADPDARARKAGALHMMAAALAHLARAIVRLAALLLAISRRRPFPVHLHAVDLAEAAIGGVLVRAFRSSPNTGARSQNYTKALTRIPMAAHPCSTASSSASSIVVFQILFALPAAYALAKLRFRGREAPVRAWFCSACWCRSTRSRSRSMPQREASAC